MPLGRFADVDEKVLFEIKSPYQEIKLTQLPDGEVALYLDNAIQFVTGHDDKVYHGVLATMPARMLSGPSKVLILGGGDGLAARNLLRFPNIREIRMVELDPGMVEFSSKHPLMRRINEDAFRNPRLKVTVNDARKWVKESPEKGFQLAILDFPDPLEDDLEDLFEAPFYRQVLGHLDVPRAIFSVQSSMAFGDVEEKVEEALARATRTKPYTARFVGQWMMDGAVVYAGHGVVPKMTRLPDSLRAKEALGFSDRNVLGGVF